MAGRARLRHSPSGGSLTGAAAGETSRPRVGLLGTAETDLTLPLPTQPGHSLVRGGEGDSSWRGGHASATGVSGEGEDETQN